MKSDTYACNSHILRTTLQRIDAVLDDITISCGATLTHVDTDTCLHALLVR